MLSTYAKDKVTVYGIDVIDAFEHSMVMRCLTPLDGPQAAARRCWDSESVDISPEDAEKRMNDYMKN